MARPPPPLLQLLLLLLMCAALSLCSFPPSKKVNPCAVRCWPQSACKWTKEKLKLPEQYPEQYALKCSSKYTRIDGVYELSKQDKDGKEMVLTCNFKKHGLYWTWSPPDTPPLQQTNWRRINTVECTDTMSCTDHSPLVSTCRQPDPACFLVPLHAEVNSHNCTKFGDAMHVTLPKEKKSQLITSLTCDAVNGVWIGKLPAQKGKHGKDIDVPRGSNVVCVRGELAKDTLNVPRWTGDDSEERAALKARFASLLNALFYLIGGLCWFIYASYYWWTYVARFGAYLIEQASLVPREDKTSFYRRQPEDESDLAAPPGADEIPTVPVDAEAPETAPLEEPAGGGRPQTEKDAQAPNSTFHDDKKEKRKKKKKKEQISDEQYDSVVAMDKYYSKQNRAEQLIEDFSDDDLEESWRKAVGPASVLAAGPMPAGPSRHSKMSVKNNGTARGRLNSRLTHNDPGGVTRRMAESIKAAEEEPARSRSRARDDSRGTSGLLDSKAESGGTGF